MKRILLYFSIFVSVIASSQEITLYNLRSITQSTDVNPAFQPNYNWHLSIPGLSSTNISVNNSGFAFNDYLKEDTLNYFLNKLDEKNVARVYFSEGIIDFGFRVKNVYITFRSQLKNDIEFKYSNSFLNIIEGNLDAMSKMPKNIDFGSETAMYENSYLETGIGASVKIDEHLTVGANIKYLIGIANAEMKFNKFKLKPSGDDLTYEIEGSLKTNGMFPVELTSSDSSLNNIESKTNNFKFSTKNSGFGVDLGAVYDDFFIKGLQVSASINDLGFISWDAENSSEATLKSTYTFSGADLSKATAIGGEMDFFDDISDKIKKNTKVIPKNNCTKRTTYLVPKINLGATYNVISWFDINTLIRSLYYSDQFNNQISIGGTLKSRFCDFALNYSYLSRSFANVGTGVNLKLGVFNMYFITDNVLASFFPKDAKNIGIRLGMNFVFGDVKKRSVVDPEKKGIENYDTPSDSTKTKTKTENDDEFDKKKKDIDEKMDNKKKELEKIDKEEGKKED